MLTSYQALMSSAGSHSPPRSSASFKFPSSTLSPDRRKGELGKRATGNSLAVQWWGRWADRAGPLVQSLLRELGSCMLTAWLKANSLALTEALLWSSTSWYLLGRIITATQWYLTSGWCKWFTKHFRLHFFIWASSERWAWHNFSMKQTKKLRLR